MSAVINAPSQSSAVVQTPKQLTPSQVKAAKDKAARKAAQQARSSTPAGATSTPGSMQTHQERDPAVASKSGPGPENIDYGRIILDIAQVENKGNGVKRFVSNKAKQHVFFSACKAVKSILGMPDKDKDGKATRLDEVHEKALRGALEDLHNAQFTKFKAYGGPLETSDMNWREDVPTVTPVKKLGADGQPVKNAHGDEMWDVDFREKMIATVSRPVTQISKMLLNLSFKLGSAKKKLEHMKSRLDRYDAVDIRKQDKLVTILEHKDMELTIEKGRLALLQRSTMALNDLLDTKQLTEDQYKVKLAEIEAEYAKK